MSKKIHTILPKFLISYHELQDHLLYIPGVGHVAPDTYSGYGSLLDSDVDDDTEVTSSFYVESNTFIPDSILEEVPTCVDKSGKCIDVVDACVDEEGISVETSRSGDLSPSSKKFNRYCAKFLEKRSKNAEKRVFEADEVHGCVDEKGVSDARSVELSPKSKKFESFYTRSLERGKK